MENETPTPQDPSRFSKAKSEPPILDLEATEHKPQSSKADDVPRVETKAATPQPKMKTPFRLPIAGFIGGMIGGGVVALGIFAYTSFTNDVSTRLIDLENAIAAKAPMSETIKFETRLSALETSLAETKSALAANVKRSVNSDPAVMKRLDEIETAFKSLSGREPVTLQSDDRRALRLALIFLLRDDVKSDQPAYPALNALESLGEVFPAFISLKDSLGTPLPSYAALVDEAMSQMKSVHDKTDFKSDDTVTPSRFPSFLSQLITVRPAKLAEPTPIEPNDVIEPIVTALEDQHADEALKLVRALPENMRVKFKALESDIARRANVEASIAALLDDALNAIIKGDKP